MYATYNTLYPPSIHQQALQYEIYPASCSGFFEHSNNVYFYITIMNTVQKGMIYATLI